MPKFPEPPARLAVAPATTAFPAGTRLWRIYFAGGMDPGTWNGFRFFGPTNSRFDHHDPLPQLQGKGILYAAGNATTCLAEVFQIARVVDRVSNAPWLVGFELDRGVELLDLTGNWPTQAGASMAINSGPRPRARRWSNVIHSSYSAVEGLFYGSSMRGNQPAVALYERAATAVPAAPFFIRPLADPTLRGRLSVAAAEIGYGLV